MAKCDLSQKSKDGLKSEKQLIHHINRIENQNKIISVDTEKNI